MRLRLTVQRNSLPATSILWSIPLTASPHAYTIARLLEDVNQVIPLEAEQWGLEDYIVEVAGFECMHFSPVAQTLKEDDQVCIRPLLTAEVRSRTLCGRYQISEGGQHLVDGIPFGRPYLRQPNRPALRIPPRKRQRQEEDSAAGAEAIHVVASLTANGTSVLTNGITNHTEEENAPPRKKTKMVHFQQPDMAEEDDSEDDEEFAPSEESEDSDVSMEDSDANSDSSEASSASPSDSDSNSEGSSLSEESETESDASSGPDIMSSKSTTPPGLGSKNTQNRNKRRRDAQQLKKLKDTGVLDQNATLEHLRSYLQDKRKSLSASVQSSPVNRMATSTGKRKRLDVPATMETTADDTAELERRKQELMAKLSEDTTQEKTPEAETAVAREIPGVDAAPRIEETTRAGTPNNVAPERPLKRLRPDTTAIGRILARQARVVEKKSSKAKAPPTVEQSPEPEGASDPDFYKSRINLSAFECWDEEFELTAPPFPFKQHWDPVSKLMREKMNKKKQRKGPGKGSGRNSLGADENEESIVLDYGGSSDTAMRDTDTAAAIESQLIRDVQIAAQSDLPPLPEDVSSLSNLAPADIKVGALIAAKLWILDAGAPEISDYVTATVEQEGDSGGGAGRFKLKLAERDIRGKEMKGDEKGNRLFDTADGLPTDDEDEEDGLWEGTFAELVEPKLLKAAG